MILSTKANYELTYECDSCHRAPKMIQVHTLEELAEAHNKYKVYKCSRCEKEEKKGNGIL